MALADRLRRRLPRIRSIPGKLGLRPHSVTLLTTTWSNGITPGDGDPLAIEILLTENGHPPRVKQLSDQRIAMAGLPDGAVEIGPITTPFDETGLQAEDLRGKNLTDQQTFHVRIVGPMGDAKYVIQRLFLDRPLHWKIVAAPRSNVVE